MPKTVLRSLMHPGGLRRVDIIHRDDGTFGFEEWFFSEHPDERLALAERGAMGLDPTLAYAQSML
jgi:hypothetical protein